MVSLLDTCSLDISFDVENNKIVIYDRARNDNCRTVGGNRNFVNVNGPIDVGSFVQRLGCFFGKKIGEENRGGQKKFEADGK